jgi:hypothetical protein
MRSLNSKYLHDFIAKVVNDLHGDTARVGLGKGRDVSLLRLDHASALTSALSVVFRAE